MAGTNEMGSVEGQLVGLPLAGPESFSIQQLAYLKKALGVDETVLWENSSGIYNSTDTASISESMENFDHIRFEGYVHETSSTKVIVDAKPYSGSAYVSFACMNSAGNVAIYYDYLTYTSSSVVVANHKHSWGNGGTFNAGTDGIVITKIVGIHRIAGGN